MLLFKYGMQGNSIYNILILMDICVQRLNSFYNVNKLSWSLLNFSGFSVDF